MSIKYKFLSSMIFIVLTAAILLGVCAFSFYSYVSDSFTTGLKNATALVENHIENHEDVARQAAEAMSYHPEMARAMEATLATGDHAPLAALALQLATAAKVDFVTVADAEGVALARSYQPENYGDSLMNQLNIRNAIAGQPHTDIETGTQIKLSVRSGAPVYNEQGVLLGAVSAGFRLDTDATVDALKRMTGTEVTIFLGDTRVATTVLDSTGRRVVDSKTDSAISTQVLGGTAYAGKTDILGRGAIVQYTPLRNAAGQIIGMLFAGQHTAAVEGIIWRFLLAGGLCALVMVLLSLASNYITANRVARSIKEAVAAATALAKGDLNVELDMAAYQSAARRDETFELASAFHNIVLTIRQQTEIIDAIASGDYSVEVPLRGEHDVMGMALKKLVELNNSAFSEIVYASGQVTGGASQMAAGVQALASGTTQQAAAVEELSSSIVDILRQSEENTRQATTALDITQRSGGFMSKAMESMERMTESMDEINSDSKAISQVISVIDNIAFQTNILSLNASVEAARAGQHGKGFAVVAEEVRNLAAKSAKAAKETADLIQNSMRSVQRGTAIAQETSQNLGHVADLATQNITAVTFISESSARQSSAIAEVNRGIEQISSVVQQNSATAQEGAAASHEMNVQAQMLTHIVGRFKLNGAQETFRPALSAPPSAVPILPPPGEHAPYSYSAPSGPGNKYF